LDTFKEVVWKRDHPQTKVSIINQLDWITNTNLFFFFCIIYYIYFIS
jgi:hypothetical protein